MKQSTKVTAEDDKQEIKITREFELPVELLFKAYVQPEIVEQWMGTKVLKLDSKKHGSYRFVTTGPNGSQHGFNGTIHEFVTNEKITRTFEMEGTTFPVQLEFLQFIKRTDDASTLIMHIIYKSVADRNNVLKLPFVQGINMAHNRLQNVVNNLYNSL